MKDELKEMIKYADVEKTLDEVSSGKYALEIRGKISKDLVDEISKIKKEPEWMRELRLKALEYFEKLPTPKWLSGVEELDLDVLSHYVKPEAGLSRSWEDVPEDIRKYYVKLGIPEQEAKMLAGLSAQYESETIYLRLKEKLTRMGVVMLPMEEAIRKYPDVIRRYMFKVFPYTEHKFAALHAALWSGGVFIYVPPNVKVSEPIEAFFLIGKALEGQFEHTLLVADEGSYVHFIEGCAAPAYKGYSFHDGMVEIYVHKGAKVKFTTLQNWSSNVINFNNKRAILEDDASIEWVEASIGSKVSYVYPSTILKGRNSSSRALVVTIAKKGQLKDSGSKAIHVAPNTRSRIVSKSVSFEGGINVYRGLVRVLKGAKNSVAHVECDSLVLDPKSKAYTIPHNQVDEPTASVTHEAYTGKISEEQLFYLMSRGLSEYEAKSLIVLGFIDDLITELPFEFANVLRSVIQLEFSKVGGVG